MRGMATRRLLHAFCCILLVLSPAGVAQQRLETGAARNIVMLSPGDSMEEIVRKAAHVVPSQRQFAWQELEFIAFVHFGMNTFTDREWGLGTESPSAFNPTDLDARQWVKVLKDAGMRMVILTAKHHDGFCLWPSAYTDHGVKNSSWRGGAGDVVREVASACREFGLKFGVYLSPWDRHEPSYGDSPKYNQHFRDQLRELLTNYGEISEVWFDGANGEGPNGKKQVYDWQSFYALIRELQPKAVISGMGPDVRWVGTESGYGRETEWSVLPNVVQNLDAIAAGSQQNPVDGAFVPSDRTAEDLGSREKIRHATSLVWYPAETDVSIRPGWFYHADQDSRVKTPEKLVDIYYSSVGRNSVLLLNVPPDKRGRISDSDIKSLTGMRKILDQTFARNLLSGATISSSNERAGHSGVMAADSDNDSYWTTDDSVSSATLECVLPARATFDRAALQENIRVGQRVERFHIDVWNGQRWIQVAKGTTIGYKRLLRFPAVSGRRVRLVIDAARTSPAISSFGLYKAPPRVLVMPDGGGFEKSENVRLSSDVPGVTIYYTLDGTRPTFRSPRYRSPITLDSSATLTALAAVHGELCVETTTARFTRCMRVRAVVLEKRPSPQYPGHGAATLTDGCRGSADFHDIAWLGFEGDDMTAMIDLGRRRVIKSVTAGFLQEQGSWIFLPSLVTVSVSSDGKTWNAPVEINEPVRPTEEVLGRDFRLPMNGTAARFVRVVARNVGICPPWHPGAGSKAWLFVDELFVQ
jgi:alpha-L-fucosidase